MTELIVDKGKSFRIVKKTFYLIYNKSNMRSFPGKMFKVTTDKLILNYE